jgi:hypothetical protein
MLRKIHSLWHVRYTVSMGMKFDDRVLVVLATAPAGLGHLRVMEALKQGLSDKTRLATIGVKDESIQWIHRLTSRNRQLKRVMEFTQENGIAEKVFSKYYRSHLRKHTLAAEKEFADTVTKTWPQPEVVVVIATHFGLAHQLAAAREALVKKLGVKLVVAVVVTDDSPQRMWAVDGVDVIFVPSNTTREAIVHHLMVNGGLMPQLVTIPYPISLWMGAHLSAEAFELRKKQVRGDKLHVMLPISGAAVQLDFFKDFIGSVTADGVSVSVVSRDSHYTKDFLDWCRQAEGVDVIAHREDLDVVKAYDKEYELRVIGAEVTKPSEQAFKALYTPKQRGGVPLLFTEPVGRQEKDNLAFLRRHKLMPSLDDQAKIDAWCLTGNRLPIEDGLLDRAHHWRGVMLPKEGSWAGIALQRLISGGILSAMVDFEGFLEGHQEITSDGVDEIWEQLRLLL